MSADSLPSRPPPPPPPPRNLGHDLQPFFVLHKHKELPATKSRDSRRSTTKASGSSGSQNIEDECARDDCFLHLRMEAFDLLWSQIHSAIKDVLRSINTSTFKMVYCWVNESFQTTKSWQLQTCINSAQPYPVISDVSCRRIFTGLVFTKNVDFVDDVPTFQELGLLLKSEGCHVAHLSSIDISAKCGIGGCLRSLLRQFLKVTVDAGDISILTLWYNGQQNHDDPLVIVVEDMEKCCGSVLSELILMLSEWAIKLPVILVFGVTTMLDAPKSILSSDALHRLNTSKFVLESPFERMDAIVDAVLLRPSCGFSVDHKVAAFFRKYFLQLDGSLASFTRALKVACLQHFSGEPLSFLLQDFARNDDHKYIWSKNSAVLMDDVLKCASRLPSCQRKTEINCIDLTHGLVELKKSQNNWLSEIKSCHEAGKFSKVQLLDLYCEALHLEFPESRIPDTHRAKKSRNVLPPNVERMHGQYASFSKSVVIRQSVSKLRNKSPHLESLSFHEVICFKDIDKLQSGLLGDPRSKIQNDLSTNEELLRCICCQGRANMILASLHDTSILYLLAKEHGDVINLHDWYQSFKTTATRPSTKAKCRPRNLSPKKRKRTDDSADISEATIQARFCRAFTELQILGLVRMPSRRRPDYVQSIVLGVKQL